MDTWLIVLLVILGVAIVGGIIAMLCITFPIANKVYKFQLVRTSKDVWGSHECSAPDNEEQVAMWKEGLNWADGVKGYKKAVHIVNDGFNLFGEYYDFGFDKAVIILPGRCECLKYSYFYALPYQKSGYNVLVIDTRCHGDSDGTHSSIGKEEHKDVLAWCNLLIKDFSVKKICLHCICVGGASGILACTSKDCPKELQEICVDGIFTTFRETFKQHMKYVKKPVFPVLDEVMFLIYLNTKTNVFKYSPKKHLKKLTQKILFLHTKLDAFSKPELTQKLYDSCPSQNKKLVWFDKGLHSHVRINNHQVYDDAIMDFFTNETK